MRYEFRANYRDWELISETFDIDKYNTPFYDYKNKLGCMIECWQGNIPIYLNNDDIFISDYIKEISIGVVTPEPIFSIFDKENITFEEMLDAIQERIPGIVKPTEGDDNPYEPNQLDEKDMK
jgi:hypothetical protein